MKKKNRLKNTFIVGIMASICCGLWGSAFPVVKIGFGLLNITSDAINSQILFAGMRFTLAGVLTIIIGSFATKRFMIPSRKVWPKIIVLSLIQTILQYVFFYIGLAHTSGVNASIVQGMNVFVSLLVASTIFHQEKLSKQKIIGCIVGFIGVVIINFNANDVNTQVRFIGEGFILLSTVTYAFSTVILKHYAKTENTMLLCGYQFLVGGMVMVVVGIILGGRVGYYSIESVGILVYLGFVSAIAYSLWGILIKNNPISKVAVYGFMTPVFGVILSTWLLNEQQSFQFKSVVSVLLVSAGIIIVNYSSTGNEKV